jgi:tRNA pseudouridine38-40 synthase
MTHPYKIIALWCWYSGERFHGYQQQQGLRTVQKELLGAFLKAGLTRNPVVAGRTDKGVSARMQVLSCRLDRAVEVESVASRINEHLPPDIGIHLVREVRDVKPKFHAAWSSNAKEYRYVLPRADLGNRSLLEAAARLIPGTKNYKVFHFKTSETRLRTVTKVELFDSQTGVTISFQGEGFARYMIRMLVGAMTLVSSGGISLETMRLGLENQIEFYCPTAPAEPLTLWNVGYPPACDPFTDEERSRFVWPRGMTAP